MIHGKSNSPNEIFSFSKKFRKKFKNPFDLCSFNIQFCKGKFINKNGFNVVISANQMLRASYPAMHNVAKVF